MEITFHKNRVIGSLVYEYISTKDQTGPVYWDHTPEIPEQVSGTDNYYNHGIYTGWQHWGMGIGNPLVMSPIYNDDGEIVFKSNRSQGHHFGVMGNPVNDLRYRILFSFTRNWGTYSLPFYEIKKNGNVLMELTYTPHQLKGWDFTGSLGVDRGGMLGKSAGGMLTIRKTGWIR